MVCGDGQCDSPGHTAKNVCYFLMELVSDYILDAEVRDKRHVGLASTNMERQTLQNALQRLRSSINIVEVVTDASTSIKKMIGKIQFTCDVKCSCCLQLVCQIYAQDPPSENDKNAKKYKKQHDDYPNTCYTHGKTDTVD